MDLMLVSFEHQEPYLAPLAGMIVLLFLDTTVSYFKLSRALLLSTILFLWGMFLIFRVHIPYTAKVDTLKLVTATAQSVDGSNFLIQDDDLFQDARVSRSGFWFAESMIISALDDPQSARAIVPVSNLELDMQQIPLFLDTAVLNLYFTSGYTALNDSVLLKYADIYFKEAYKGNTFKMWFADALNPQYFDPPAHSFQWFQLLPTEINE